MPTRHNTTVAMAATHKSALLEIKSKAKSNSAIKNRENANTLRPNRFCFFIILFSEMTPAAALDPYLAAEAASLNTLILSASFGFTSSMLLLGTELTIIKGTLIERLVLLFVPTTCTFAESMGSWEILCRMASLIFVYCPCKSLMENSNEKMVNNNC